MRSRAELEKHLINDIRQQIKPHRKYIQTIKEALMKHNIMAGTIQAMIDETEHLNSIDNRVLCLLAEQVHKITGNRHLIVDKEGKEYYTETEVKQAHSYEGDVPTQIELPLTLNGFKRVNDGFIGTLSAKFLMDMWDSQLITYNFETQREARYVQVGEEAEPRPNINQKSVIEIASAMESGKLFSSTLTFNLRPGTADDGDEYYYDEENETLTITKGTMIDILDGMHRLAGSNMALRKNGDINFDWEVRFVSYSLNTAKRLVAQYGKVNLIDPSKIKSLEGNASKADEVVKEIQRNSDFGKLIAESKTFPIQKFVVSFEELSKSIDKEFKIKTRNDMLNVSEYLINFFNTLLAMYPDELENNKSRKELYETTLISHSFVISSLVHFAKLAYEKELTMSEVRKKLKEISFDKSNDIWKEKGILNEGLKYTSQHRTNFVKYLDEIMA